MYCIVAVLWAVMYLPPQLNKEHITKYPVLIDMSVAHLYDICSISLQLYSNSVNSINLFVDVLIR